MTKCPFALSSSKGCSVRDEASTSSGRTVLMFNPCRNNSAGHLEPPSPHGEKYWLAADDEEAILLEFHDKGRILGPCRIVETVIRNGLAFFEITEAAKALNADLIIIGTHGYSGVTRAIMGSTAEKVVRHAPCPVLVVRRHEHEFIE